MKVNVNEYICDSRTCSNQDRVIHDTVIPDGWVRISPITFSAKTKIAQDDLEPGELFSKEWLEIIEPSDYPIEPDIRCAYIEGRKHNSVEVEYQTTEELFFCSPDCFKSWLYDEIIAAVEVVTTYRAKG